MSRLALLLSLALFACGGGGDDSKTIDAPHHDDAPGHHDAPAGTEAGVDAAAGVQFSAVSCTGATIAATVTTVGDGDNGHFVSDPAGSGGSNESDITVNEIIEFTLPSQHPAGLHLGASPFAPGGASTCIKFTSTGELDYVCTFHGFPGKVIVSE